LYTPSLHDALPICAGAIAVLAGRAAEDPAQRGPPGAGAQPVQRGAGVGRLRPGMAGRGDRRPPAAAVAGALVARAGEALPRHHPLAPPDPAHRLGPAPPPVSGVRRPPTGTAS